jgi:DNA-binding MarR family transcriptional regulator
LDSQRDDPPEHPSADTSQRHFVAVAHARYVMRTVTRIVDEQAKQESLESLEHQALIQVCGALNGSIRINVLAERLDIVPAFASRLVGKLESRGLVSRTQSTEDRRVTLVSVTEEGLRSLERINESVQAHVRFFREQLTDQERDDAFRIFAFYVGAPMGIDIPLATAG